jgi:large repetitive protein
MILAVGDGSDPRYHPPVSRGLEKGLHSNTKRSLMRFTRILLLFVLAAGIAGVVVPNASALAFVDDVCPVADNTVIKVCPQGQTGKPYSLQMQGREGTGCVPYVTFSALGALPTGLTMSSSGLISGTPTQAGEWTFWVSMKDIPKEEGGVFWCSDAKSTERQFSITIVQGLQIVQRQSTLTPAQLNTPYSLQFTTTGGGSPSWSVSSGSLPAGITLNSSTGLLAGTPTAIGDYTFKVTAADGGRSDAQTYTLNVVEPLRIATALPAAEVGLPFTVDLEATGGKPAWTWSLSSGNLPAGLTLEAATGVIGGKPTAAGSYPLKLTVTDALGLKTTKDVTLKVAAKLTLIRKPFPTAVVGKKYLARVSFLGGVSPRVWKIFSGKPPAGFILNRRTGILAGTPKKAGMFRFSIQVRDKLGALSTRTYLLKVLANGASAQP